MINPMMNRVLLYKVLTVISIRDGCIEVRPSALRRGPLVNRYSPVKITSTSTPEIIFGTNDNIYGVICS